MNDEKHFVLVLDILECLGQEGAAWVVGSAIPLFFEDGFLVLGDGEVAASITAPVCGWPGQLHALKFNIVVFALRTEMGMWEEPLSALLANTGKKLNCVGQPHV